MQNLLLVLFFVDRDIYNAYKSVIQFVTPNADTILVIEEVKKLKKDLYYH